MQLLLEGRSLADAGLWPDMIRSDPDWAHTRSWHYINVPDGADPGRVSARQRDHVLAALDRYEADLRNTRLSVSRRRVALRFVTHFVADIHQPLHVGRAEDRGGNRIDVFAQGRRTNLHAVWDGQALLRTVSRSPRDLARSVGALAGPGDVRAWQAAVPVEWAAESMALRPRVYGFASVEPGSRGATAAPRLDAAYLAMATDVVQRRLAQAGIRLAGRLNAELGCRPVEPPRPSL